MSYVKLDVKIDYKKAMDDYNKLLKDMGAKQVELKISPVSGKITQKTLKEVATATDDVTEKTKKATAQNEKLAKSQENVNKKMDEVNGLFANFGKTLSHNIGKMAEWAIAGTLIFGTLRKIGEGVQYVKEMDMALAEIRMASGMTSEQTKELAGDYLTLAKNLGIAVEEIATSAKELYRQGLNTQQVNERLADYIKLSKVLGRELSSTIEIGTAGATTFATTIEKIGDVATAVGDATASSGDEIMIAIQKGGMAAQTAGVSLEEYAAMAATISSTTRESGAVVGNAMKSILSKMSQVNDLTGDINEDFGKTLKAMQKVGIQTADESGELLTATEILNNLGAEWDNLSEKEQKYVANTFGVYQVNRFTALLKGMTTASTEYVNNLKVAYDSFGTTAKKYEEYKNTVEYSNEVMKNEFKELYQNAISPEFLKFIYEAGSAIIDFVDDSKLLQVAAIALAGAFIVLNAQIGVGFVIGLTRAIPLVMAGTQSLVIFGATLGAVSLTMLGVIGILGGLVLGYNLWKKKQEEAFQATLDNSKALRDQSTDVKKLMESISDLKGKTELTTTEQIRMTGVIDNLKKIYPELSSELDKAGNNFEAVGNAAFEATKKILLNRAAILEFQASAISADMMDARREASALEEGGVTKQEYARYQSAKSKGSTDNPNQAKMQSLTNEAIALRKEASNLYIPKGYSPGKGPKDKETPPYSPDSKDKGSKHIDPLDALQSYRDAVDAVTLALAALDAEKASASDEEMVGILERENEQYELRKKALAEYGIALDEQASKLNKNSETYQEDLQKIQDEHKKIGLDWWENEKAIQANIKAIEELGKKIESEIKKKAEDANKELLNTLKKFDKMYDKQKDSIEERYRVSIEGAKDELEALKRKNQELEDETERNKILLELEKARLKLKNILNEKNVKLYTGAGSDGWEWVADPQAVQDATETVFDLEERLREYDVDANRRAAEQKLADEIDALERAKDAEIRAWEERKQKYQDFLDKIQEAMDTGQEIQMSDLEGWWATLTEEEKKVYGQRLIDAQNYVNAYNAIMAQLNQTIGGTQYYAGSGDIQDRGGGVMTDDEIADRNRDAYLRANPSARTSANIDGQKAVGGSAINGKTYQINEAGTEGFQWQDGNKTLFRPLTDGKIITANNMKNMLAGSGGQTITIGTVALPGVTKPEEFMPEFVKKLKTISNNTR